MFKLQRNQIIITALVVMVAVAGYLNYTEDSMSPAGIALSDEGEVLAVIPNNNDIIPVSFSSDSSYIDGTAWSMGDSLTVDDNPEIHTTSLNSTEVLQGEMGTLALDNNSLFEDEISNISNIIDENNEPGTAIFVNSSSDTGYFVQAKLDREQSRAKQKEILTGMINNDNIDQAQKAECADAMLEIQQRIEKETAAEAMIESKGFAEVYVRIDDNTVDVVVNKESLTDAEIAQIEDIVKRKTGMESDQIRISPMK